MYGNHESFPCDQMDLSHLNKNHDLLNISADIWKSYLDKEADNHLRKFGYYSMYKPKINVRILALNT